MKPVWKPFEEKFKKQADAIERVGARMDSRLDEISGVMDVVLDDLSAQERKRVYDLNTVVDISELDKIEKEYLCSVVYAVTGLNSNLSKEQKEYLRALKSYLMVTNVQADVDLASIENIENITTQRAILQTIMEFLFLEYGNHDYMDDYEDVFDYFSVNRKGVRKIQDGIDNMYATVGLDGIAEHYGSTKKVTIVQGSNISKADLDLRAKAEDAYLRYDIKSAMPLFSLLAEQGDGRSCYFLGNIYQFGYQGVVCRDPEKAMLYRKKGADAGDLLCVLRSAESAETEEEKDNVYVENYEAVLTLAQGGDTYAMYETARLYHFAYETIKDKEQALSWYEKAAEAGLWSAINNLGNLYFDNGDHERAAAYYQKAADIGYNAAVWNLALCYENGDSVEKDLSKANALTKKAAEIGNPDAQLKLGKDFLFEEEDESIKWLSLSANNGVVEAYYYLAEAEYRCGEYGDNGVRSLAALLLGAHFGDRRAQIELAHKFNYFIDRSDCAKLAETGVLDRIGYEIDFGTQKVAIKKAEEGVPVEPFAPVQTGIGRTRTAVAVAEVSAPKRGRKPKGNTEDMSEELVAAAANAIKTFAEESEHAAQYYLGMSYAWKCLNTSTYTERDKQMALKWLNECNGKDELQVIPDSSVSIAQMLKDCYAIFQEDPKRLFAAVAKQATRQFANSPEKFGVTIPLLCEHSPDEIADDMRNAAIWGKDKKDSWDGHRAASSEKNDGIPEDEMPKQHNFGEYTEKSFAAYESAQSAAGAAANAIEKAQSYLDSIEGMDSAKALLDKVRSAVGNAQEYMNKPMEMYSEYVSVPGEYLDTVRNAVNNSRECISEAQDCIKQVCGIAGIISADDGPLVKLFDEADNFLGETADITNNIQELLTNPQSLLTKVEELAEKGWNSFSGNELAKSITKDIAILGLQLGISIIINAIIRALHTLCYDEAEDGDPQLYEVRTRKILSYSNLIASGSNIIYTALSKNIKKLDIGGITVTIYRVVTDHRFIQDLKREFLSNQWYDIVMGDDEIYDFLEDNK